MCTSLFITTFKLYQTSGTSAAFFRQIFYDWAEISVILLKILLCLGGTILGYTSRSHDFVTVGLF